VITLRAIGRLAADYRSSAQARQLAYLEHAQEHFLLWMEREGLFDRKLGTSFKGGTAIRKFHLGGTGRFSTDLDFAIADAYVAKHVIDALGAGFECEGVTFKLHGSVDSTGKLSTHGQWVASVPGETGLGSTVPAKLDFSLHPVLLPTSPQSRAHINTIDADTLGFEPPCPPLFDLRENVAEKLCRTRRALVARDVFDLAYFANEMREHLELIREMVFLKVFGDVVHDSLGERPFRGGEEYIGREVAALLGAAEMGSLTQPDPEWAELLERFGDIYGAGIGAARNEHEGRLAACNASDAYWHGLQLDAFVARNRHA